MALSPLNARRWRNFKRNRRALWSLVIFSILFGLSLFKPTELFGLTGFDLWTHALFWTMLLNVG